MKSTEIELEKRGFVKEIDTLPYHDYLDSQLFQLLTSKKANERTIAVRLLARRLPIDDLAQLLLDLLAKESSLYTKIEIGKALEMGTSKTCQMMGSYLGTIGSNQYQEIPAKVSKKISYPLPRDIVARIMGRMTTNNIDTMIAVLNSNEISKISEVLDAIGFLVFYHPELSTYQNFQQIKKIATKYLNNKLILWKCITCFSAFPLEESEQFLTLLKTTENHLTILMEIDRSLILIKKNF